MTPEEMCIAVAEACPSVCLFKSDGLPYWRDKLEAVCGEDRLTRVEFDPLNDLNAMHEAEKVLTDDQWDDYRERLEGLDWRLVNATAAQRAEAFCRVMFPERFKPCT